MKNALTKSMFSMLLLAYATSTFAQREISIGDYLSPTYAPMMTNKKTDLRSSPFLSADWLVGEVVLGDGKAYHDVKFNYDLSSESLVVSVDGGTYTPNQPVKKFTFVDNKDTVTFKSGYLPTNETLYQVLYEGPTTLLKHSKKSKIQREDHFTGNTEISFVERTSYYLVKKHQLQKISPTEKGILKVLSDKKTALEDYINTHSTNLKEDSGLAEVINYYNTLQQ